AALLRADRAPALPLSRGEPRGVPPSGGGGRRRRRLVGALTGPLDRLPERLVTALAGGSPALLLTVGADGLPASAFTWAVALDDRPVGFAAAHATTTLANPVCARRAPFRVT